MSAIANPALLPPGAASAPVQNGGVRAPSRRGAEPTHSVAQPPFADVLAGVEKPSAPAASSDLRFSRHALQRVERRGVSLDASTLDRLSEGIGRAAGKGSRASVVLVDGTAFVVSVTNKTVLTAVPQEHMKEQVFTNIDSAVIA
jgi:flagellar operon protein